jgi:oligopeptide/dipeptide ABC transporter ATP-binding protein
MYLGQMVEKVSADELFANPLHPYTKALLSAIPEPIVNGKKKERKLIKGEITSPVNLPDQCRFLKRCDQCQACCETGKNPELVKDMKDHGLEINTFTVNQEEEVRRFYALGIDGIISNFPDMAMRVLAECAAAN